MDIKITLLLSKKTQPVIISVVAGPLHHYYLPVMLETPPLLFNRTKNFFHPDLPAAKIFPPFSRNHFLKGPFS
jgi:hypothetical protein